MIKNIKIFPNSNIRSMDTVNLIKDKFTSRGFLINDDDYDLAIAVGGDGSFLRMVHSNDFNSDLYYVGVNSGTLGFAQEVNVDLIDDFILELETEKYKVEEIGVQETVVNFDNQISKFCSLNEMVVRDRNLGAAKFDIKIDDDLLERYVGDGVLISTPFGSTAQNLSYGGSIVYNDLYALQITPIAPINSKVYSALRNSIIVTGNRDIRLIPFSDRKDMIICVDGNFRIYNNIDEIKTTMGKKRIKYLRFNGYNFSKKINDKILNG